MRCFVSADVGADFADFEDVGVLGMFGAGDLKSVPKYIVGVKVGIGCNDDAFSERLFGEVPSDDDSLRTKL